MVTELDYRCRLEHPVRVDDKLTMLQRVDVTLDKKKIGATLDGKESLSGNIDTVSILEVLNGCSGCCLKLGRSVKTQIDEHHSRPHLNDSLAIIRCLWVDDDVEFDTAFALHDTL